MKNLENIPVWVLGLEEEDLNFVHKFILASGSLKNIAQQYGISYPTVRLRLNRLIKKIELLEDPQVQSPFHQKIRMLVAEGKLDVSVAKTVIRAYENNPEKESS
jgi:hypothetical protein